jgi:cytoskeleton protein RodZ
MSAEAKAVTPSAEFDCAICGAQLDRLHLDVGDDGPCCSFCGSPQDVDLAAVGEAASGSHRSADVGDTLRNGRVVRGETLEQAARFTRIRLCYLRNLEDGDTSAFDPYPGRTYARFFLREYADHLGLDPVPLVRRFDAEVAPAIVSFAPLPRPSRPVHQRRWAIGAALVLFAFLSVGALLSRGEGERETAPPVSATIDDDAGFHPIGHARTAATEPEPPLRAVITTSRDCWILASEDDAIVLQETVRAGTTITLRASRTLDLRLGDAGAARLVVNGRPIPTGDAGDVAELSFTWRDGSLVRA